MFFYLLNGELWGCEDIRRLGDRHPPVLEACTGLLLTDTGESENGSLGRNAIGDWKERGKGTFYDKKDPIRQFDLATDLTHPLSSVLYPDSRIPFRPREHIPA